RAPPTHPANDSPASQAAGPLVISKRQFVITQHFFQATDVERHRPDPPSLGSRVGESAPGHDRHRVPNRQESRGACLALAGERRGIQERPAPGGITRGCELADEADDSPSAGHSTILSDVPIGLMLMARCKLPNSWRRNVVSFRCPTMQGGGCGISVPMD